MKNHLRLSLLVVLPVLLFNCQSSGPQPPAATESPNSLVDYFTKTSAADSMLFEINQQEEAQWQDTIPSALLFSQIETRLMNGIDYFDNSDGLTAIGRTRFPLTDSLEAFVVDLRQNWYRHLSLFIFDPNKQTFTARKTLAEFYGGDGGQILTGSWLTDYDGDGDKDLICQEIEHWIILDEENQRDTSTANAMLFLWENDRFSQQKTDAAGLIRQWPITSWW